MIRLFSLAIVLCASSVCSAVVLEGVPALTPTVAAIVGIDTFSPIDFSNQTARFDVFLRDSQGFRVDSMGPSQTAATTLLSTDNLAGGDRFSLSMGFLDYNGNPTGPSVPFLIDFVIPPSLGFITFGMASNVIPGGGAPFTFSGIRYEITGQGTATLLIHELSDVSLIGRNTVSLVANPVPVPEPVSATLGLIGLATLGMVTRRRAA